MFKTILSTLIIYSFCLNSFAQIGERLTRECQKIDQKIELLNTQIADQESYMEGLNTKEAYRVFEGATMLGTGAILLGVLTAIQTAAIPSVIVGAGIIFGIGHYPFIKSILAGNIVDSYSSSNPKLAEIYLEREKALNAIKAPRERAEPGKLFSRVQMVSEINAAKARMKRFTNTFHRERGVMEELKRGCQEIVMAKRSSYEDYSARREAVSFKKGQLYIKMSKRGYELAQ